MRLDRRLRETSFGSLEGKTTKEIVAEYGESILRDLNDPEQVKEAFKPENHQWLPAIENIKKGKKYQNKIV